MTETYWLGPCPADERAAQSTDADFDDKNRAECRAFIAAIVIVCGEPPPGAALRVKTQGHDFATYREVVVEFDPANQEAAEYAARCDAQAPTTWAAAGLDGPEVRDILDHVAATRKLRHLDQADDREVTDAPDAAARALAPQGKRYVGRRHAGGTDVTVHPPGGEPYELPARLDLRSHSPDGFNWGYPGSGPAQLALALAADALGNDERARRVYQALKSRVVAALDADAREMTEADLRAAVARIERDKGTGWKL